MAPKLERLEVSSEWDSIRASWSALKSFAQSIQQGRLICPKGTIGLIPVDDVFPSITIARWPGNRIRRNGYGRLYHQEFVGQEWTSSSTATVKTDELMQAVLENTFVRYPYPVFAPSDRIRLLARWGVMSGTPGYFRLVQYPEDIVLERYSMLLDDWLFNTYYAMAIETLGKGLSAWDHQVKVFQMGPTQVARQLPVERLAEKERLRP